MFNNTDKKGRAPIDTVLKNFLGFYLQRGDKNYPVKKERVRIKETTSLEKNEASLIMLQNPFEKFEKICLSLFPPLGTNSFIKKMECLLDQKLKLKKPGHKKPKKKISKVSQELP